MSAPRRQGAQSALPNNPESRRGYWATYWVFGQVIAAVLFFLPSICVAGVFHERIGGFEVTPSLAGFMVSRERAAIRNYNSENQTVAKLSDVGIIVIKVEPSDAVGNIPNVLFDEMMGICTR
jgi:hypothetical protein